MSIDFGRVQIDSKTGQATISPKVMGMDPKEIVKGIMDAQTEKLTKQPEATLDKINKKTEALSKFESLIQSYKSSLEALRGVQEGITPSGDLGNFIAEATSKQSSYVGANGLQGPVSSAVDIIDINMSNCTDPLSFDIQVNQLAQQDVSHALNGFTSTTQSFAHLGLMNAGQNETMTIQNGTGSTVINISSTMCLQDLINSLNNVGQTTGLLAQSISVTPTDNRLYFQATQTGTPLNITYSAGLQALGGLMPPDVSKVVSYASVSNPTVAQNLNGNLYLGVGAGPQGSASTISISNNNSLNDIRDLINAQANVSGVTAQILSEGGGAGRLMLSTTNGSPLKISSDQGVQNPILPVNNSVKQTFLSAQFLYQNTPIVRTTNEITDLIPNATLTLKKADPYTTVSLTMQPPRNKAIQDIETWINEHNKMIDYIKEQTSSDSETGASSPDAHLRNSVTLQRVQSFIQENITSTIMGTGTGNANCLAQIGIKLGSDGHLSIDQQRDPVTQKLLFLSMIETNFNQVRDVLAFNSSSNNANFSVVQHSGVISDQITNAGINVQINKDAQGHLSGSLQVPGPTGFNANIVIQDFGTYLNITVDPNNPNAGLLSGLNFHYSNLTNLNNNSSESATISLSQGITDRLMQNFTQVTSQGAYDPISDRFTNQGELVLEREDLKKGKTETQKKLNKIKEKLKTNHEKLVQKFTKMAADVLKSLNFQKQLDSFLKSADAA